MIITVQFFATFRDIAGTDRLKMNIDEATIVADLIMQLEQQYPKFNGNLEKVALVAVNEKYVERRQTLQQHDVVAFFPPVSGG